MSCALEAERLIVCQDCVVRFQRMKTTRSRDRKKEDDRSVEGVAANKILEDIAWQPEVKVRKPHNLCQCGYNGRKEEALRAR